MRRINRWIVGAGVCFAALVASAATIVPASFNYQGVLRDGSGNALLAENNQIEFKLYNVAADGDFLWGKSYTVLLSTNGLFNVELTDATGSSSLPKKTTLLPDVIADNPVLYLGITVAGAKEIAPRQQLLSVPYALLAGDVQKASGNFKVVGTLTAASIDAPGATLKAEQVELTKNNNTATLAVNSNNNFEVESLDVTGNLGVSKKLTVTGATEIQGATQLFSRISKTNDWTQVDKDGDVTTNVISSAVSDGFIILNLWCSFDLTGNKDKNILDANISFEGAANNRVFEIFFETYDMDGGDGKLRKTDLVSLPVLKDETVTLTMKFDAESHTYYKYKYMFIPFGTTK